MQKGIKRCLGVLAAGVLLCSNTALTVSAEEIAGAKGSGYSYINIGTNALDTDRVIFVGKAPEEGALADKVWTESLAEAFSMASPADTILLRSNVTLEKGIIIKNGSFTLDLGGYTITGAERVAPLTVQGGDLYLAASGGGRIVGGQLKPPVTARARGASAVVVDGGRLTVESGNFVGGGEGGHGVEIKDGRLTILKGNFTGGSGTVKNGSGLYAASLSPSGNIAIWNGTFLGGSGGSASTAIMSGTLNVSSFISQKAAPTVTIGGETVTYDQLESRVVEKKLTLTSASPLPARETLLPKYQNQTLETNIPGSERTVKLAGFIAPDSDFLVSGVSDKVYNSFLSSVEGSKERLVHIFNPTLTNESGQAMAYPYVDTLKLAIGMGKAYKNSDFIALVYQNGKVKSMELKASEEGTVVIPLAKLTPVALAVKKGAAMTAETAPAATTAPAPDPVVDDLVGDADGEKSTELVMGSGVKEESKGLNPTAILIAMSLLSLGAFGWSRLFKSE